MWLECIDVVSGCCCKKVYRFPHNNCYLSLLLDHLYSLFWWQHPYFFVQFLNVSSFLFMLILCNIANVAQRTFEIVKKSRSCEHGNIIIWTRAYVDCARAC